jgi:type IV pilus assembly protein PilB
MSTTDIDRALAVLCLEHQLVTPARAVQLIESAQGDPRRLASLLVTEIPEVVLLSTLAKELRYDFVDLYAARMGLRVDVELLARADRDILRARSALPLLDDAGTVIVAVANPADLDLTAYLDDIYPGHKTVLVSRSQIQARLALSAERSLAEEAAAIPMVAVTPTAVVAPTPRNPLVVWVDTMLETAVAQGASDIHLNFTDTGELWLRFRIDSILHAQPSTLRGRENEVIGILMTRAGMDAANQRDPQDGGFSFIASARKIDVRAAMLPQEYGPSMVLRLLDSVNINRRLSDMGFSISAMSALETALNSSQGTIIVSGPTGAGKTTTLYAMLREVASPEKNVITIEDPVEYRLPLVNQTEVSVALDFPRALRAILRMDPDIILVGEIRDAVTARTAMDAAITGHLVLSTVHARSTVGIYTRLAEMGTPHYLVAEAMSIGVAQRLVRRLHDCATPSPVTELDRQMFAMVDAVAPETIMRPRGCTGCNYSGYRGRIAVVEILVPTPSFRQLVLAHAGHDELDAQARADGMIPILEDGLRVVHEQMTTIDEVIRAVSS